MDGNVNNNSDQASSAHSVRSRADSESEWHFEDNNESSPDSEEDPQCHMSHKDCNLNLNNLKNTTVGL